MKKVIFFLLTGLFSAGSLPAGSCSKAAKRNNPASEIVLVASTPGDSLIRSVLHIPTDQRADYIRWHLIMRTMPAGSTTWVLNIRYGEEQPGTPDFKAGGYKLTLRGTYTVTKHQTGNLYGDIYRLESNRPKVRISMVMLTGGLFHLLTMDDRLMVGNGGFSYTLNRQDTPPGSSNDLPSLTNPSVLLNDTLQQVIFEGRTPCRAFEKAYHLPVAGITSKIKWKLILYRDPRTFLSTTYKLRRIDDGITDLEGKWTILKGGETNPDAIIYQLDPDQPGKSIYFLVGSPDVIFFLDPKQQPLIGNSDFSFTLNKRHLSNF